jgi:5-methylcytosine-specific restriction endonuclease McrA
MSAPVDAIALAERILALLDEGRRSTTYKLAVLASLLELCLEHTGAHGEAPETLTTRQLAAKVIELYWPQTSAYAAPTASLVLRQSRTGNAELVDAILRFRARAESDPEGTLSRARQRDPDGWRALLDEVEWVLIEMPLPRLQVLGGERDELLYAIGWDEQVRRRAVRDYQRGEASEFDNRIHLRPGVGEALVRLHGLLRPLLQRKWAEMVARLNRLEEARLEHFLFGAARVSLEPLRGPLVELHEGRCFYCDARLGSTGTRAIEIDHFVPWSRHPENAIENLVPTHAACNQKKRDLLAGRDHVERWRARMRTQASVLAEVAAAAGFEGAPARALSVARAIYVRLPSEARLWVEGDHLESVGGAPLAPLFAPLEVA